jgi:hypothetical protein
MTGRCERENSEVRRVLSICTIIAVTVFLLGVGLSGRGTTGEAAAVDKVLVCHREGNGDFHSINVTTAALGAHLEHGDAVFSGFWRNPNQSSITHAEIRVSGTSATGVWNPANPQVSFRPAFNGTLVDGCTVLMSFPGDGTYEGTLTAPCHIQWSFKNQPGTTDPNNFWVCSDPF